MLPINTAETIWQISKSDTDNYSDFLNPDNTIRKIRLVDYELGPIALSDNSQGNTFQPWKAWSVGDNVYLAPTNNLNAAELVYSHTDIQWLSVTFDLYSRPVVVIRTRTETKLYWHNTNTNLYETQTYHGLTTPIVFLDDKRNITLGYSDVLFCYLKDGNLYHRLSRDLFQVEYLLRNDLPKNILGIDNASMTAKNRVMFRLIAKSN